MARHKIQTTEYRNYYLPLQFPVIALAGDHWKISDINSGRLHFHNCLEIGICHSDSGTLELYGDPVSFRAGDITVIPRNVPHTTYSAPGTASHWSYLFLSPRDLFRHLLPEDWKNHDLLSYGYPNYRYIFPREEYPFLHQTVTAVIEELTGQQTGYQLRAKGLLLAIYIEICRAIDSSAPDSTDTVNTSRSAGHMTIAPALDYIENNYRQQFTIEALADQCHLSPTHFRRVFRDIMGTGPLEYVNSTRILKSCNLLCSTEESVLNISELVGFQSVSSYNRYFIRIMQIPPLKYRKKVQKTGDDMPRPCILEYSGWTQPERPVSPGK